MHTESTRRSLFGASAGLLLLAASAAGPAKAAELDGELLALEAELQAAEARADAYDHEAPGNSWEGFEATLDDYWQVIGKLEGIPARTPEGLQAKARIVRSLIKGGGMDRDGATGQYVEGLLADLLGEV